jgi:multisubunit Na+/H+ antiporter MnhF subunit
MVAVDSNLYRADNGARDSRTTASRRLFKHPRLMPYNRLLTAVVAANTTLLCYEVLWGDWWSGRVIALNGIATVAQANFALAIVLRQQHVINFLSRLAIRAPTHWPLRLRWALAKVHHFGGLHVGAAVSGTLWYLLFVGSLTAEAAQHPGSVLTGNVLISYALVTLFLVMVVMALPPLRARAHDKFEVTHRFCGWAAVVLVWINTVLFVAGRRGDASVAAALVTAPTIWMLVVTTACAALPWLRLRKVPITVDRPSAHVALAHFDHGVTPFIGSVRAISRHPLLGWHTFANIPAAGRAPGGYRMAISRAGDWTAAFIDDPPAHVWVRGVPTAGMANVRKLFTKVGVRGHRQRYRPDAGPPPGQGGAGPSGVGDPEPTEDLR